MFDEHTVWKPLLWGTNIFHQKEMDELYLDYNDKMQIE
jgi:hypothetical protein